MKVSIEYDDPETEERLTVEYEVDDLQQAEDIAYALSDKRMTYVIKELK